MGIFDAYDESTKTNTSVSQCTRLIDYVVFVGRYDELHDAASSPFSSDNDVTENRRSFDFENTRMPILLRRLPYFDHDDFKLPLDVICFAQPEGCAILPTNKIILHNQNKIGNTYNKNSNNDPFDASISSNSTDNNSSSDESSRTVQLNHDNRNFPSSRENLDNNIADNQNYLSSNNNAYIDTSHREITTFVFTLTDKDSGRTRFGICLNYYQTIYSSVDKNQSKYTVTQTSMLSQEKVLTSLCILSHYPFFSTFRNLLILTKRLIDAGQQFCCDNFQRPGYRAEQIYWDLLTNYQPNHTIEERISHFESEEGIVIEPMICNILYAIENWLQRLLLSPVPIPGKTKLQLNVLPPFYEPQNLLFALPDSSRFCLIDFPLHLPLELLGIETCLKVLTCLVLEQKVVLQSRDHNALTMSVLALVAMIYPLEYMFPIIPLLPITLHGSEQLLLAPTPYFIGIPSSFLIYKGVNLPKDVWLVDLDTNKIVNPSGLELPPFPEPEGTILRNYLKQALHSMSIDPNFSTLNDDNPSSFIESNATIDKINSSHDSLQDRSITQRNTENFLHKKDSFTQNSLLSLGDVDSVDMATRIAMVNFLDGPNVFSHFEDHCHILRLYPRPVVAFQIDSFIKSRPRPTRFVYELAKTQAFEYFAEWSLCPTNTAFQRVRIGITDPRLIGDKPKWYIHSLVPQNFSLLQSERIPRKSLSVDTKSYEPESIITILFDHYYEQLRNNSNKNYSISTDKPMKIDVLTNQLITANTPKRYTSFSVGGLDEQASSHVISDDDASIMALKPPSTVDKSVSSPEDDNVAYNDDHRNEQENQSSNTSTPSSNSEEISNSDSISSPPGSVPSSVPTLANSKKIPFDKCQPVKENIPSHKRVSKQKPFFLNPSPRKKTSELLKYDQEKGLCDISTSEDTVSSNLPARRKNKSQRRVKNRESTGNTYGDKLSNSQNMNDLTALYIDHLQHERQSVGHPNMDYNALDNDEIDELLHRRPDLSSHSAVDQLDDIGDRLIQSFSTTINTLTLPRKLFDNYGKTFWFKSRQEVSMDHVLPYGTGGMDSELIEKTKKAAYLDNGTKKLPLRLPRGDSANMENRTLAEQHIDYKRKPYYRSGEQINFTGVTRAPSVRSEMGPTKDVRKSIDSESSEISLQNFLLDIAENVVNGQGVGWLKLPRLRNLLKHESCRLFLINKLNTNNPDTFVFPVRKLSVGAGKIIRTTSISSRREDSIDSMIDPHSPSYNEMTANFTKHLNELFDDNKNQLLVNGKNFVGTPKPENELQRCNPVNSVFSIKPKFISHVCLSKPVWKGYQTVLRCCLSGLEFTYANYGIGGMGSAYVFLEIISTHYYYTPVDEDRDAKKQAEIERMDTSTPPLDMVENLRNQCSNIMIDPERTYKKLTRMGSKISQSITHAASNVLSNIDDKSTVNPVTNVATIANSRSASPETMMKMPKFRKEYLYETFLGKNRSKLWDESQFWQDIFLDAVSQERDMIGLDIGPGEMMNRFFHLSESERKRLESEEDNLLVIQLLNLIAFSVMMRVNVRDISRKVRRLLAKSHVGLKYSFTVNKILDAMPNYTANQIPLLLPLSRRIRKMSFTVKSGIDPNAEAMVMEICEDAIVFRSITSGEIIDKLWYDKLINMTLSPKNKVLCLWWKSGTKTYLQKFHTKKCQELYQAIRNIMERINNNTNNHRKVLGSEIGGQFEIGSLYTPDKGTLDISLDGVTIAFPDGKTTLHLDQIKKCRCQKNNKIFIFQIYG